MPNHSSVPIILGCQTCLPPSRYLSGLSSACLVSFSGVIVELSGEEQGKSGPYPFTLARSATSYFLSDVGAQLLPFISYVFYGFFRATTAGLSNHDNSHLPLSTERY